MIIANAKLNTILEKEKNIRGILTQECKWFLYQCLHFYTSSALIKYIETKRASFTFSFCQN